MRRMLSCTMTIIALCGMLRAGDAPLGFMWVVAEGTVYQSEASQIAYVTVVSKEAPQYVLKVWHNQSGGSIPLAVTQYLAKEIEPYVMLAKRGRKVEETIEHPDGIALTIIGGEEISVRLEDKANAGIAIELTGDTANVFLDALLGFSEIAEVWAAVAFEKALELTTAPPVSKDSSDGAISLKTISSDYSANEIAATQKYDQHKGKSIIASGTIRSISMDRDTGLPRIQFHESIRFFSMSCTVSDPESVKKASLLQPGQQITVEGIWRGPNDALDATIYDARIVE